MPSIADQLFHQRVLWVTGKGGTGKSTVAAALALLAAERDLRTLLIDVQATGDAARFLEARQLSYKPTQARTNLFHLELQPEEVLDEYLKVALKAPRLYRLGPVNKIFDFIANAAPGIKEVLIAGKVGFEERAVDRSSPRWDLIVVDAAPSGQVLSHLRGPRTIQEIVQVGMIRNQTAWVRDILEDPKKTGMVVVSLPEEMPVSETADLLEQAPLAVATPILAIVANRVVPAPDDAARAALAASNGNVAVQAARLFADLADSQAPYLERLRAMGPPTADVPLFGFEQHDMTATRWVAEALDRS